MNKLTLEAQQIIEEFADSIRSIRLTDEFSKTVELVKNCKGKIVTTGMGKAGIAMQKFSSILCSFGVPSCYLHPGEASHGDLGLIRNDDILFVCSVSGKTREVCEIIDLSRNIGVKKIIGITSHADSPIREKANIVLDMGVIKESGHLGIAPTTSILVILAITDCIALMVAKENKITKKDYGKYHHGGYLGSIARGDNKIL